MKKLVIIIFAFYLSSSYACDLVEQDKCGIIELGDKISFQSDTDFVSYSGYLEIKTQVPAGTKMTVKVVHPTYGVLLEYENKMQWYRTEFFE